MFLIFNGEDWIEGVPQNGDKVREKIDEEMPTEHYREYTWFEPAE